MERTAGYIKLIENNQTLKNKFTNNKLLQLMTEKKLSSSKNLLVMLEYFQLFSDAFQKMVLLRSATSTSPSFAHIFHQHLSEEFNHNHQLRLDRNAVEATPWDPILCAAVSWFPSKMLELDNIGKLALGNMIMENAAAVFYGVANEFIQWDASEHFDIHHELDAGHADLGLELLQQLTTQQYGELFLLQQQAWDMLTLVFNRIAELTLSRITVPK